MNTLKNYNNTLTTNEKELARETREITRKKCKEREERFLLIQPLLEYRNS